MNWPNRISPNRMSLCAPFVAARLVAVLFIAALAIGGTVAAQTVRPILFPLTVAYDLEKSKVTLPADLTVANNLLLLSYAPDQQKDAESWLASAKSIAATRTDFHYYILPVFPRQNILYRLWMNSSMRSDAPTAENWRWTIPLYVNKERFNQDLDIHSEAEITVLLVDKVGKVLWRTSGALTDEKKAALLSGLIPGTR